MNRFLAVFIQLLIALPGAFLVWLASFFAFDLTSMLSTVAAMAGGAILYGATSFFLQQRFVRKHGLTRKEYQYIRRNLTEAKEKISRINKTLLTIRHISSLKQRIELMRLLKRIYSLTKHEPKRFYKGEPFYFSHLDSIVELSEKYAFLSRQLSKSKELNQSLVETRQTLDELTKTVEKDLYQMLAEDIEDLHFELDVAKQSINRKKELELPDESRRSK
ncbi:5-bromo-4-chloroindolyl phosphate hydrolysis family protein [Peribacillus asahii]|uniref:5-bromo-4-chloroindolyl phosphate hydrolysis family protein n=1 Tax=Peribacillus asahii TaxID=228899 RepID=UPI002079A948|nr:5-bromo-4-chloroindolyl phosphate hydrolysis family protein [Peribacillus asahii]USK60489.1 5-bromo-4-chloroindolyl phosphate hydrolysis family protein [Peribacillus asahii]